MRNTTFPLLFLLLSIIFIAPSGVTAGGIGPLPNYVEVNSNQTFVLAYQMWWNINQPAPYGEGYFTCSILLEVNSSTPQFNFTYEGYTCAWENGTEIPLQLVMIRRPPSAPDEILLTFARTEPVEDDGIFWLNVTIRAAGQQNGSYIPNAGGEQTIWTVVIRVWEGPNKEQLGPEPITVNVLRSKYQLMLRAEEINLQWVNASRDERRKLFKELVEIDGEWLYAPEKGPYDPKEGNGTTSVGGYIVEP